MKKYPLFAIVDSTYRIQHLDQETSGQEMTLGVEDIVNRKALGYASEVLKIQLSFPGDGLTVNEGQWRAVKAYAETMAK